MNNWNKCDLHAELLPHIVDNHKRQATYAKAERRNKTITTNQRNATAPRHVVPTGLSNYQPTNTTGAQHSDHTTNANTTL